MQLVELADFVSDDGTSALLNAEATVTRVVAVARVALAQQGALAGCPEYMAALDAALEQEPPPFGTEEYASVFREASADRQWLAISLMTNAEREGDGAQRLWSLAACCSEPDVFKLLQRHAVDESRHALAYLKLLDLVFPSSLAPEFRAELNQLSPRFSMLQEPRALPGSPYARTPSIDDFVQMNVAEIRTTIHHLMQRTALLEHCPAANVSRVTKVLDVLLRDELRHVAYTGVLIEQKASTAGAGGVQALFCRRMRDFNDITRRELAQRVFD